MRAISASRRPNAPSGATSTRCPGENEQAIAASRPLVPEPPSSTTSDFVPKTPAQPLFKAGQELRKLRTAVVDHRTRHRRQYRFGYGDRPGNQQQVLQVVSLVRLVLGSRSEGALAESYLVSRTVINGSAARRKPPCHASLNEQNITRSGSGDSPHHSRTVCTAISAAASTG